MADGGVVSLYGYLARVLRCVDADTCDILADLGMNVHVKERVRFLGVNCPETFGVKKDSDEYARGLETKKWLVAQLQPEWEEDDVDSFSRGKAIFEASECPDVRIITTKDKKGKYGRYLVELFVGDDEESINEKLIKMGFGADY